MNKRLIGIVTFIILIGVVGFFLMKHPYTSKTTSGAPTMPVMSGTSEQPSTPNAVATNTVDIKNFAFTPANITVKKGTTVTWTNQDSIKHSIVPDDETADFKSSQLLTQGDTYKTTFNTPGTFTYHCGVHPDMKATVIVTE